MTLLRLTQHAPVLLLGAAALALIYKGIGSQLKLQPVVAAILWGS
jgi:hypothetical protein